MNTEKIRQALSQPYLIPVLLFGIFIGYYCLLSLERGHNPMKRIMLTKKWDINHYKTITTAGYHAKPCHMNWPHPRIWMCGNAGWFPGWPLMVKPLYHLTGDVHKSYALFALLFTLLSFVLLFYYVRKRFDTRSAIWSLLAMAFFPSSFYLITGFPYAFMLFMILLYLIFFKNRYLAFVLGFCISATYPSGFFFALYPAVALFLELWRKQAGWKRALEVGAFYILPFALGPLAVCLYFHFQFGDFFLYLKIQEPYQHRLSLPWSGMVKYFSKHPVLHPDNLTFLLTLFWLALFSTRKIGAALWAPTIAILSFTPMMGSLECIYRHYLLAFPLFIMIGLSRRHWMFKASFLVMLIFIGRHYFSIFLKGNLV